MHELLAYYIDKCAKAFFQEFYSNLKDKNRINSAFLKSQGIKAMC